MSLLARLHPYIASLGEANTIIDRPRTWTTIIVIVQYRRAVVQLPSLIIHLKLKAHNLSLTLFSISLVIIIYSFIIHKSALTVETLLGVQESQRVQVSGGDCHS